MNNAISAILAIVGGVIGLAIVSVLVSKNAQTPQVLGAGGSALANVITAAVSPVTGTGAATGGGGSGSGGGFSFGSLGSLSSGITSLGNIGSLFGG